MRAALVINVVGLTPSLLGSATPNLQRFAARGGIRPLVTVTPAVTCPVQTTLLCGLLPRDHGIVGNGWYFRDLCEIMFWRQSNRLVSGERVWEAARARDPGFTCANLFWWYNMYSSADIGVTPRPIYPADGRKIPDHYAAPPALRQELNDLLGQFPLFRFWGPAAGIASSAWITRCALHVYKTRNPTLTLVYLPHLDYNLQRLGPSHPAIARDLTEIDSLCTELIETWEGNGGRVLVLSEYGITSVTRPIHINRALRGAGLIQVREELGREMLDPGASRAFAVADHQVAHLYIDRPDAVADVKALVKQLPGVERVLDAEGKAAFGIDHARSGDLVAIADATSWFTYYFWLDDTKAPDFARTVEIHRKPGYDPVELFLDPAFRFPKLNVGWRLAKRHLGFRTLLDVIPLNADLVKGSHGRITDQLEEGPLVISSEPDLLPGGPIHATAVKQLILDHLFS
jgi:predicted AlkP superfamily pyrophosphatase or phosphodiesterase